MLKHWQRRNDFFCYQILDACNPLREYSWLVAEIRKNLADMEIEEAVNKAIMDMPEDYEIKPFLEAHRAEVNGMLLTEYDEVKAMELFKEEGRAEGIEEGIEKGQELSLIASIKNLMKTMKISAEEAMNALLVPEADRPKYMSKL